MYSPCHIIQLALQKKNCHGIFFLCRKISFSHHPSVYFGEITRVMRYICIFSRDIFRRQFFPDVRWLLLQITC